MARKKKKKPFPYVILTIPLLVAVGFIGLLLKEEEPLPSPPPEEPIYFEELVAEKPPCPEVVIVKAEEPPPPPYIFQAPLPKICPKIYPPCCKRAVLLEARAGYFFPSDNTLINRGGVLYGLEATVQINRLLHGFIAVNYLNKSVTLVPITAGFKVIMPFKLWDLYLGAGIQESYFSDHSQNTSTWGFGGIFKSGLLIYFPHGFFIDYFVDYSLLTVDNDISPGSSTNLSGLIAGVGIGYKF